MYVWEGVVRVALLAHLLIERQVTAQHLRAHVLQGVRVYLRVCVCTCTFVCVTVCACVFVIRNAKRINFSFCI